MFFCVDHGCTSLVFSDGPQESVNDDDRGTETIGPGSRPISVRVQYGCLVVWKKYEMSLFTFRRSVGLILALGLVATGPAGATQTGQTAAGTAPVKSVQIPIQQVTLKNGLRVVLSEDHTAPTVSLCITFDVGSRKEQTGDTGVSHY